MKQKLVSLALCVVMLASILVCSNVFAKTEVTVPARDLFSTSFAGLTELPSGWTISGTNAYAEYNVNVEADGNYLFEIRSKSDAVNTVKVLVDDVEVASASHADTNNVYTNRAALTVPLTAGDHTVKFLIESASKYYINYVMIAPEKASVINVSKDDTTMFEAESAAEIGGGAAVEDVIGEDGVQQVWNLMQGTYLRLKAADAITKVNCALGTPNGTDLYPSETQIGSFGNRAYVTYKVYVPATGYYNLEATGHGLYSDAVIDVYIDDSTVPASSINDGSLYIGGSEYLNTKYNKSKAIPTFITKGYHTIKFQSDYASADAFNMLFFDFAKATYTVSGDITAVDNGETVYIYQADADGVALTEIPFASTEVYSNRYNFSLVRNGRYVIKAGDMSVSVTVADANVTADMIK